MKQSEVFQVRNLSDLPADISVNTGSRIISVTPTKFTIPPRQRRVRSSMPCPLLPTPQATLTACPPRARAISLHMPQTVARGVLAYALPYTALGPATGLLCHHVQDVNVEINPVSVDVVFENSIDIINHNNRDNNQKVAVQSANVESTIDMESFFAVGCSRFVSLSSRAIISSCHRTIVPPLFTVHITQHGRRFS